MTRAFFVLGAFVFTVLIAADPRAASLGPLQWQPDGIPVNGGGAIPFFGGIGSRDLYGPRYRLSDLDDDGDFDLFVLDRDGRIATLSNVGSGTSPEFFPQGDDLLGAALTDWFLFADIDADGDFDLFGGRMPGDLAVAPR